MAALSSSAEATFFSQDFLCSPAGYLSLVDEYRALPSCVTRVIGEIEDKEFGVLPVISVHLTPHSVSDKPPMKVLMTAGIHGDEPAPPIALRNILKKLVEKRENIEVFAFPCVNPTGFLRKKRTSSQGYDLNRVMDPMSISPEVRVLLSAIADINQTFDVVFDLHEDNPDVPCDFFDGGSNATGFYVYESTDDESSRSLGHAISEAIRRLGLPIVRESMVYGDKAEKGVVFRDRSNCARKDFERYILMNWTSRVFIPETPTSWGLRDRVTAHEWAVEAGLCSMQHQCRR